MQKDYKAINTSIFSYFILSVLVSDFLTKYLILNGFDFFRVGTILKAVFAVFMVIWFLLNKLWLDKTFKIIAILLLFFSVGQITNTLSNKFVKDDLFNNIFTLSTFLYMPILAISLTKTSLNKVVLNNINWIKKIALFNIPFVLMGLLFQLDLFKSYPLTQRFGYNGILSSSSAASYFYIFVIIIHYGQYILNKNKRISLIMLFIQLAISILVGTKTIWFFVALLSIIHFSILISNPYRRIFNGIFSVLIALVLIFRQKVELFIVSLFNFGEKLYNEYGFITVITSTRDLYLKNALNYFYDNGTIFNFLFGGINVIKVRVEFEFVNLLLFFGLIGSLVYLIIMKKIFFHKEQSKVKTLLFFAVIITCSMSGGLFYSVFSSTLFLLVFKYLDILLTKD